MNSPAIGSLFTFTRRDLVHGSLTFHIEVVGVFSNGTVAANQYAIGYPDGSVHACAPLRLDITRTNFRDYAAK